MNSREDPWNPLARGIAARILTAGTLALLVTACGAGSNNQPPKASSSRVATDENVTVALHLEASDPEGSDLAYRISKFPDHGTLLGSGADRTYTPNANWHGSDSLKFSVTDPIGAASQTATVSITVRSVNDVEAAIEFSKQEDAEHSGTLTATEEQNFREDRFPPNGERESSFSPSISKDESIKADPIQPKASDISLSIYGALTNSDEKANAAKSVFLVGERNEDGFWTMQSLEGSRNVPSNHRWNGWTVRLVGSHGAVLSEVNPLATGITVHVDSQKENTISRWQARAQIPLGGIERIVRIKLIGPDQKIEMDWWVE